MHDDSFRSPPGRHDFSGDHTREVIGAYYEVYNGLPRGLLESAYAGGMLAELTLRGIPVAREVPINVHYKGAPIGWYRADLVVDQCLVLELKAVPRMGDPETRQLYHYLRVMEMPLGLLLNFGALAQVVRVANSEMRHKWTK
jgi:GxxExxY protein